MNIENIIKKNWNKPTLLILNISNTNDGGNEGDDFLAPPPSGS
jgi:hypothetical protein